jgi:hypothetical protein
LQEHLFKIKNINQEIANSDFLILNFLFLNLIFFIFPSPHPSPRKAGRGGDQHYPLPTVVGRGG